MGSGAWQIERWGELVRVEREVPQPGPGEVRLSMRAASLNYRDVLMIAGRYDPRQALPLVPLSDGVGVVEAVGAGVTRVAPGDRVTPLFCPRWLGGRPDRERLRTTLGGPLDGVLRAHLCIAADSVVRVPAHLSDAQAATLPCAALTAWNALTSAQGLAAGDVVLIQGTGGVSIFALQFAKLFGLRTIVTSKSDEKLERARALGADHTINYRTEPEWGRVARALSGRDKRGVDLVVEVGGAGTLAQSLKAVAIGGQLSLIGILAGSRSEVDLTRVFMQQVRIQGLLVGSRDQHEAMVRAIEAHRLEPVVDRTFGFDEALAALDHLRSAEHFGKVVIDCALG